jgi:uridine kinase
MNDVRSVSRRDLLDHVANRLAALPRAGTPLVAIDGVDGSGKTRFADELVPLVEKYRRSALRASVDDFHNPRAVRYRLGKSSPEGYFLDSYDYVSMRRYLLDPLIAGEDIVHTARFDHVTDQVVESGERRVEPNSILILDGIFLHRDELRKLWSFSIFLHVPFEVSFARMAVRDGNAPDPSAGRNRRYLEGQKLYLAQCRPTEHASLVIDNSVIEAPKVIADRSV